MPDDTISDERDNRGALVRTPDSVVVILIIVDSGTD